MHVDTLLTVPLIIINIIIIVVFYYFAFVHSCLVSFSFPTCNFPIFIKNFNKGIELLIQYKRSWPTVTINIT
jgi:hypothetical protein